MQLRWILVIGIVLAFAFQAVQPYCSDVWLQYRAHLKFAVCLALCIGVLLMPSMNTVLHRNRDVVQHFMMHLRDGTGASGDVVGDRFERMTEGSRIASVVDPDPFDNNMDPIPAQMVKTVVPVSLARGAARAQLGDIERRTVAARQQWKCGQCRTPLNAEYRVWVPNEGSVAIPALCTALCPACFEGMVLQLRKL